MGAADIAKLGSPKFGKVGLNGNCYQFVLTLYIM